LTVPTAFGALAVFGVSVSLDPGCAVWIVVCYCKCAVSCQDCI